MFKKGFLIDLDVEPKTDEDICLEVAKYCGKDGLTFEFIKRTSPVIAMIDGTKYEIQKRYQKVRLLNCWVLSCREID
ncbi:TPA: DUF4318 domain-containing protein [Clostridium perfringens]|uniref:DUF4318 domain-containing protein n=2 Tax=Clostridium perfringens TaxID=1502 RepID=UPI0006C1B0A2|nr:DUF4318 domain-containing protein [Clostridium perfringens]ELC8462477.1 DUF4318 domain-containing protein [Clostridium perfringens]MDB2055164.1 DUF4318 domain-containing protein [Clostridium perfringens]MDK0640056.1 DUF4318 domain-containing protein [Clostridium perfringens]MDK0816474.1 DUF4318 domain-containing protein [Clostridium perfringens]MDM0762572.1 DUF4318 domain-containing protein [Clostridium perfringens]